MYEIVSELEAVDGDDDRWANELDKSLQSDLLEVLVGADGDYYLIKEVEG